MFTLKAMSSEKAIVYHAVDDYYSQDGSLAKQETSMEKQAARWHGKLAATLGLGGQDFDFNKFANACRGKFEGKKWKQKPDRTRALYDFTLSAPKSVSIQALHGGDTRLIEAHDKAVDAAMDFMETKARLRITKNKKESLVSVDGLAMALMRHTTSRKGDPALHTHGVNFNAVMGPDGLLRSLTPDVMMNFQRSSDAIYKQVLAAELRKCGYELIPNKDGYELAGYDREVIDHFSQRLEEIKENLAERGLDIDSASPEAKEASTLATRDAKREIERSKLKEIWRNRAKEIGFKAPFIPKSLKEQENDARRKVVKAINRNLAKAININRAIVENSRLNVKTAGVHVENFSQTVAAHRVADGTGQGRSVESGARPGGAEDQYQIIGGLNEQERGNNRDAGKPAELADHDGAGHGQYFDDPGFATAAAGRSNRGNAGADRQGSQAGRQASGAGVSDTDRGDGRPDLGSDEPGAARSGSQEYQDDQENGTAEGRTGSIESLHATAAAIRELNDIAPAGAKRDGSDGLGRSDIESIVSARAQAQALPVSLSADQALTQAMTTLTANKSVIENGPDELMFMAMTLAHHRIAFNDMNAAMQQKLGRGEILLGRNGRAYVSFETVQIEKQIDAAYDSARQTETPIASAQACDAGIAKMEGQIAQRLIAKDEARMARKLTNQEKDVWADRCKLTKGQVAMVRGIAGSLDGVNVVEGDAGTGKSTAMEAVKMIAEAEGMTVYGLGPSAKAVEALCKTGITTVTTASAMKNPKFWEKLDDNSVLVIDEAGLVGAKTLDGIIRRARDAGARLVFVGDTKQFNSVEAGAALVQLRDKARANGSLYRLDEMRRGETEFMRDLHFASRDNSASVLDMLHDKGHINVIWDRQERLRGIGQAYASRTEKEREDTMILTDRNVDRIAINHAVRAELSLLDAATVQNFERRDATETALLSINCYEEGDVIRFDSDSDKYEKDTILRVVEKHPAYLMVEDELGRKERFEPNLQGKNLTLGTVGELALAVGERIRFTANEKAARYVNGDAATIVSIKDGMAQVRMDKNKALIDVKLDENRPVDFRYGYCQTGRSTQGGKGAMVIKHKTAGGMTNKNSWYTTNTRSTNEIRIFTDIVGGKELENLRKNVERRAQLDLARRALEEVKPTKAMEKEREAMQRAYFAPGVGYEKLDVPCDLKTDEQFVKEALTKAIKIYRDAPTNTHREIFVAGSEDFKRLALDVAMKENMDVRFANADIEDRRAQIIAEQLQTEQDRCIEQFGPVAEMAMEVDKDHARYRFVSDKAVKHEIERLAAVAKAKQDAMDERHLAMALKQHADDEACSARAAVWAQKEQAQQEVAREPAAVVGEAEGAKGGPVLNGKDNGQDKLPEHELEYARYEEEAYMTLDDSMTPADLEAEEVRDREAAFKEVMAARHKVSVEIHQKAPNTPDTYSIVKTETQQDVGTRSTIDERNRNDAEHNIKVTQMPNHEHEGQEPEAQELDEQEQDGQSYAP